MTSRTLADAFADAATRMIRSADVSGSLVALLTDCAELTDADSAGLLIQAEDDTLDLLSSTSHATTVLELYELQHGTGPCLQAVQSNVFVAGTAPDLAHQWAPVGQAIVDAGYGAVYAFPLRWHDRAVGALNLYATTNQLDETQQRTGQAFANLAVAVLAHPTPPSWPDVHHDILDLLEERIAIEQAKGVLAVQHGLDLSAAYHRLITTAAQQRMSLAQYAREVINSTTGQP
jgi:hypothetical protein